MTPDTPAMDEKGLTALARAYDREDASQRGEPSPWDDGAEDATWRAERLACAKAGRDAYLAATARDGEETLQAAAKALFAKANEAHLSTEKIDALWPSQHHPHWRGLAAAALSVASLKASQGAEVVKALHPKVPGQAAAGDPLDWAVYKWHDEVANRPLVNVHRRSLDDTWRQVIRHFGGDPVALCGPSHDDLLSAQPSPDADGDAA